MVIEDNPGQVVNGPRGEEHRPADGERRPPEPSAEHIHRHAEQVAGRIIELADPIPSPLPSACFGMM